MHKHKQQKGFTIVELLIVIVVIGILAALVLNSFAGAQKKARNTQTVSIVKAHHSAILSYIAETGAYPPDWACLGTGYPDINNDGTPGDCSGNATDVWVQENASFNTAIQPYIGNSIKKINPHITLQGNGTRSVGAYFLYEPTATLNGTLNTRWIVYALEGTDSKCSAGPIVRMDAWPVFNSGSHNGVSENWWQNGVICWIPIPQNP